MFKPISFNVVRQAIQWSDLPLPTKIRMLSSFKWPDGSTSGEYVLTWDGVAVREATDWKALHDGSDADVWFRYWLQQCFCSDIQVVRTWCDPQHDLYKAELYAKCSTHDLPIQPALFTSQD
jgi:hypothetical protein